MQTRATSRFPPPSRPALTLLWWFAMKHALPQTALPCCQDIGWPSEIFWASLAFQALHHGYSFHPLIRNSTCSVHKMHNILGEHKLEHIKLWKNVNRAYVVPRPLLTSCYPSGWWADHGIVSCGVLHGVPASGGLPVQNGGDRSCMCGFRQLGTSWNQHTGETWRDSHLSVLILCLPNSTPLGDIFSILSAASKRCCILNQTLEMQCTVIAPSLRPRNHIDRIKGSTFTSDPGIPWVARLARMDVPKVPEAFSLDQDAPWTKLQDSSRFQDQKAWP